MNTQTRPDPFGPLFESALAQTLRTNEERGEATHAIPTHSAPLPLTMYGDGRARINLGTNNYLGLAGDPRMVEAAQAAIRQYGTSATGSRMLNGTTLLHLELEEELAEYYDVEAAVLTSSGINANTALLSTIGSAEDTILVDAHAHASVHAGAAASRAATVRFTHNDSGSLQRRLERLAPGAGAAVVVDGVYSMSGEVAPLEELAALCRQYGARLIVDEAHGLGALGERGRGAAEAAGVLTEIGAITIAFSKSLASVGGAILTSRAAADGIRAGAVPYLFSAAGDPAATAAALTALRILQAEPERRVQLQRNALHLRQHLELLGAPVLPGQGAVLAVLTGTTEATVEAWHRAFELGVYTNTVSYPAVPKGRGVLRLGVMATHTQEQIVEAAQILAAALRTTRSIPHQGR